MQPATAVKVTNKQRALLEATLEAIITRSVASEKLYRRVFPNKVLVERYLENKAKMEQRQNEPR